LTPERPRILITNDDGYDAPGILALAGAMRDVGEVTVVAPNGERSACSHSLTLERPLRLDEVAPRRFRVNGTPTDCVHLAMDLFKAEPPQLVLSGINRGPNVGDDLTYSGTVAGALEGCLLHTPAVAFSCALDPDGNAEYDRAAAYAKELVATVMERPLAPGVFLNVNFPVGKPKGTRVTRQGTRSYRATSSQNTDPTGRTYYWIAGIEMTPTGEADGDHRALQEGYVSITPLSINWTHDPTLQALADWPLDKL